MNIGTIVDLPSPGYSQFATVRDVFGSNYTVPVANLGREVEIGEDYAYHVEFMSSHGSNQTLNPASE